MSSNAPDRPDSENRDRPAFDAAQKRAAAADIARRISAFKRVQDVAHAEPGDVAPMRAEVAVPAPEPLAPESPTLESQVLESPAPESPVPESPASEPGMSEPAAAQAERPAHPMLRATALGQSARRRIVAVPDIVEPYLGRAREDRVPHPQLRVEPRAAPRAESADDLLPRRVEPEFSLTAIDAGVPDDPRDAWLNDPPAPRRRRFRPVRFAAIAATLGTAAGALMLWQFGLGDNARQIVLTTAAQISPGETVETPATPPQAVTVTAQPATAPPAAVLPERIAAPAIASSPEVKPDPATAPAPTATSDPAEPPQPAEVPAPAPTAAPAISPAPAPAFVAQPFEPNVLTPPANALPPMPNAASIAAAPISIPPTPTDSPAISQPMSSATPQSFSAAPSAGAKPAPRVVAQLKPAAKAAAAQPGAKPFVPTAKAAKPKPVSKPAATKPSAKPSAPFNSLLEFLSPNGGKAPPTPSGNRK